MTEQLYKALALAQQLPGERASVRIAWHPYRCGWQGVADWSDRNKVESDIFNEPHAAIEALINELQRELDNG